MVFVLVFVLVCVLFLLLFLLHPSWAQPFTLSGIATIGAFMQLRDRTMREGCSGSDIEW